MTEQWHWLQSRSNIPEKNWALMLGPQGHYQIQRVTFLFHWTWKNMRIRSLQSLPRIILRRRLYSTQSQSLSSPSISVGLSDPFGYCADLVRKHDYESYLISQFWPKDIRGPYLSIKAFSVSLTLPIGISGPTGWLRWSWLQYMIMYPMSQLGECECNFGEMP